MLDDHFYHTETMKTSTSRSHINMGSTREGGTCFCGGQSTRQCLISGFTICPQQGNVSFQAFNTIFIKKVVLAVRSSKSKN